MNRVMLAHLALLLLNMIYAANHLLAKGVTPEYLGPDGFILFRAGITAILFSIIFLIFIREKIDRKDWPRLIFTGILGCGLSQLLFFNGLAYTSAMNVGVLMTSIPIFTVILSYFLLHERITKIKVTGVVIGAIGAIALTTLGKQPEFDSLHGDFLIIFNAFIFAGYLVLVKPLMNKYNPITIVTYNFVFGALFVMLYPKMWSDLSVAEFGEFTQEIWLKIGFVVIFSTFLTYLLNVFALKYLSPSVSGSYVYTQPAFVIILTFVFALMNWTEDMTGTITFGKVIFMLMIFSGVYLISYATRLERKERLREGEDYGGDKDYLP